MKKTKEKNEPEVILSDHDPFVCRRVPESESEFPVRALAKRRSCFFARSRKGWNRFFNDQGLEIFFLESY